MLLHIVGGGCCGSVAALSALSKGYEVLLTDKEKKPWEKTVCTGLISPETLHFLSKYIHTERVIYRKIEKAFLHVGREELEISGKAYVVDRKKMDHLLLEKVVSEGGKVEYGKKIKGMEELRSERVIGADGSYSTVARLFSFPKIEKFAAATITLTEEKIIEEKSVHLYFDDVTRGFFSWIVDRGDNQEIGSAILLPGNVEKAFQHFLSYLGIKNIGKKETAPIPLRQRKITGKHIGKWKVLLVGDAAGHVKAFSGGGLAYGLRIAEMSAKYIEQPEEYDNAWRKAFGKQFFYFNLLQSLNELLSVRAKEWGIKIIKFFHLHSFFDGKSMDAPFG